MSLKDYNITLLAGVEQQLRINGNFYSVYSATAGVQISIDDSGYNDRVVGDEFRQDESFRDLKILSAVNQNVTIVAGFGELRTNIKTVSVTATSSYNVPDQITAPSHVSVAATSAGILAAAYAKHRKVFIKNPFTNTREIFIGPATIGAGQGVSVDPGEGLEMDVRAAVYAYNPHSAAQTIYVTTAELL